MIPFPRIDPVIVRIGPLSIRWYGVMYLLGFIGSYILVNHQAKGKKGLLSAQNIESLYTFLIFGLVAGARLGYVIFYDLRSYLENPLEIAALWHGGMSFHGGLIGSVMGGILFCRKYRKAFWKVSDLIIVTAPIGLGLGRLGNFINGELYGRVTDVPWAMVFPSGGSLPRHPSQIYEFLLEGVLLFAVLWSLRNRALRAGTLTSLFLILYGFFRSFAEVFRQPDPQIGFLFGQVTMGQLLSTAMIVSGISIMLYKKWTERV